MPATYSVHSLIRARSNRAQRAQSPMRNKTVQRVGSEQQRLMRGRPLVITEAQLLRDLEELKKKEKLGWLEVRTMGGQKVDLSTVGAEASPVAKEVPVSPPLPHPPLDSAANDVNGGEHMPQHIGGVPQMLAGKKVDEQDLAEDLKEELEEEIISPAEVAAVEEVIPDMFKEPPAEPKRDPVTGKDKKGRK